MKILNKSQIQEAERQTIRIKSISSFQLMERAAKACRDWIVNRYYKNQHFSLICGTGNNGGDGLKLYPLLREQTTPVYFMNFH